MRNERQVVKVVADDFGDHLPIWFPPPVFDDPSQMPISAALLQEFRAWNIKALSLREADLSEITDHYQYGIEIARKLAVELGPRYDVQILVAGVSAGWKHVNHID